MSKQVLKSIHSLINMSVKEAPIEQQFVQDLRISIEQAQQQETRLPSKTYKPSSMACIRNMYYQVIGQTPDNDRMGHCLVGIVQSGSDRHKRIQEAVTRMPNCEYVDVAHYVKSHGLDSLEIVDKCGFETKLYHKHLNISFLCDGIIKYKDQYFILEIKTETVNKWWSRDGVDESHLDQATTYSICFGIDNVMFLYECRDNCDKKCYVLTVTEDMKVELLGKIEDCDVCVALKTVPPIPANVPKKACTYCSYRKVCREVG